MGKLLIVDGNAILHRAFHAIPPLTTEDGEPINAVHGMVSMLLRIVDGLKPTHIAFAFDRQEPTFRKKQFPAYQSQRPETDNSLSSQFAKAKEVLRVMNIPFFDKAGFEADDIIGTLSKEAVKDKKAKIEEVVIVTGDKDQLQLVNDQVKVFMPVSGVTTGKLFGEAEVIEKMGVTPSQVVDYKGLVGDSSDNYPGVFGIGPKTALNLLAKYKTFPNIYENIKKIPANISVKLLKGEAGGRTSYKLAQIVKDVEFDFDFQEMDKWNMVSGEVVKLFRKYGFRSLTQRIISLGVDSKINDKKEEIQKSRKDLKKTEIEKTVLLIAKRLQAKKYAIRGSAGMVLQGLSMGVNDIDVLCDKKTAQEINKLFEKELFQKVVYSESDKFKSYFGKAIINAILVEFYGEWQIKLGDKLKVTSNKWSKIYNAEKIEVIEIEIKNTKIPVTNLETELKTSAEMGRWSEYHKMKKLLEEKNQQKLF